MQISKFPVGLSLSHLRGHALGRTGQAFAREKQIYGSQHEMTHVVNNNNSEGRNGTLLQEKRNIHGFVHRGNI